MNKFLRWYQTYFTEIIWFTIGWLVFAGLEDLHREQYSSAFINFALVTLNYYLYKK
jgi:hypothetical protein